MNPGAEPDVSVGTPADVELIRAGKFRRIPVCCTEHEEDGCTFRDAFASHFHVFNDQPSLTLARTFEAHDLFNGRRDQGRVLFELLELAGVPQERQNTVRDKLRRGLVPRDQ